MKFLAENPETNLEIGMEARRVAMKRHDREVIVKRVMEIYADILSRS